MAHFSSFHPTRENLGAIRGIADTLVQMGYASSFAINEKTKLYDLVWTAKGEEFAREFSRVYLQSINRCVVDYGVDHPHIHEAFMEVFSGANLPE